MAACSARCAGVRSPGLLEPTPPPPRCAVAGAIVNRPSAGRGPDLPRPPGPNPELRPGFRTHVPDSLPGRSCGALRASSALAVNTMASTAADSATLLVTFFLIVAPPCMSVAENYPRRKKKRVGAIAHPLLMSSECDLELESKSDLDHALVVAVDLVDRPVVGGAEARIPGLQSVRIDRSVRLASARRRGTAVRAELRVADTRLVGRAVVGDRSVPAGDGGLVEQVERVHAQLHLTRALAEADVARHGEVGPEDRAADQDVAARFQPDAAVGWPGHVGRIELLVLIARAAVVGGALVDDVGARPHSVSTGVSVVG